MKADWLLLLTNVDGFLVPNGRKKPKLQRVIRKLTPALEAQCNGKSSLGPRRHDLQTTCGQKSPAKAASTSPS